MASTEQQVHPGAPGRSRSTWQTLRSAYVSGDALWAALLAVLGAFGYWVAATMEVGQAHDPLGGRFFPVAISIGLLTSAFIVLLTPLVRAMIGLRQVMGEDPGAAVILDDADEAEEEAGLLGRPLVRVLLMMVISIVFALIMQLWAFIPASIVGMAASMWLLGSRKPVSLVVGPVLLSVGTYFIFTQYLLVRLP